MRSCPAVVRNAEHKCWLVAGTLSGSGNPAKCAQEVRNCRDCSYYKSVKGKYDDKHDAIKVLVVEDENIVAMEIQERLKRLGYTVCGVAAYGDKAIQEANEKNPDVVLMDIRLKGKMDGVEAAEKIQKNLGIPIIYLTANSDDGTFLRAKLTGPFGYILKPFRERDLQTSIEMALYKNKTSRAANLHRENEINLNRAKTDVVANANLKNEQTVDEIIKLVDSALKSNTSKTNSDYLNKISQYASSLKAEIKRTITISNTDNEKLKEQSRKFDISKSDNTKHDGTKSDKKE
ncbi:MAG: response regulator [Nitrospirae bacterium]|nr:response regulator [Nitrospirota bacterium]